MKKRAFVRYSKQGKIVPGSLILTAGSYPQGSSTWKEVPADLCCDLEKYLTPFKLIIVPTEGGIVEFGMYNNGQRNGSLVIDWGDGTVETLPIGSWSNYYSHGYTEAITAPKVIKVYMTHPVDVDEFWFDSGDILGTLVGAENLAEGLANVTPGSDLYIYNNDSLTTLDVSGLNAAYVDVDSCDNLTSFICSNLPNVLYIDCYDLANITSLDFTGDLKLEYIAGTYSSNLANVTIDNCPKLNYVSFYDCSLNEASVNHILVTLDANGLTSGSIDLRAGSNSAPSGAGSTAQTSLINKGWSVLTN